MKYPKEYLDEIKIRLKVSQVVSKSVKLKKRGKEFIGLSPFSNEKTPSFTVNDEKGFYHCFSTTEHGNIFDFVMKTQNLKFGEAVRKLASDAGMSIYKFSKQDEEKEKQWKIYNNILEEYGNYCHSSLISQKILKPNEYLKIRKISKEDINFFQLGYSDENQNFYNHIGSKFNDDDVKNSGIFYFDERKKKFVERFKGRIIFPIKNLNGSIIAFAGRSISQTKFAKYINSPETNFYKKGNNLYNIHNVRKLSNSLEDIIFVEGYFDVISLHKFGIKNIISNQGTALTEKQLMLAWRFFKNSIVCFDGDKSGQQAAIRAAERLFPFIKPDKGLFFIFLPQNSDPDSFINEKGKSEFEKIILNKIPVYDFLWNYYFQDVNRSNPTSLALFEQKIKLLCEQIIDKSLSKYFYEYFLDKLNELTPNINLKKQKFYKFKKNQTFSPLPQTKKTKTTIDKFSSNTFKEYSLLYIILNNIEFFSKKIEMVSEAFIFDKKNEEFKNEIINLLANGTVYNKKSFDDHFINSKYSDLISQIKNNAPVKIIIKNKNEEDIQLIFNEICAELKSNDLKTRIAVLEKKAAENLNEKTYQELLNLKNKAKIS